MRKRAFTLIEVMMALIVVSVMLAVLAPVIATPPKKSQEEVRVLDTTPVGIIVAWYGVNYPDGWISLDGQTISEPKYEKLRSALSLDTLPNLNATATSGGLRWIIKAR